VRKVVGALFLLVFLAVCAFIFAYGLKSQFNTYRFSKKDDLKVVVVYNPSLMDDYGYVVDAYRSVLEEEGVPVQVVSISVLLGTNPEDVAKRKPVIIFPDGVNQVVPEGFDPWLSNYLKYGGSTAIIYDVGVRDRRGAFLKRAVFGQLTGVNYMTYDERRGKAYTYGFIRFKDDESRRFFEIPYGKLDEDLVLNGYGYGKLEYPSARNKVVNLDDDDIYAFLLTQQGEAYPAIVLRNYGRGSVLYVNLPLGYAKSRSDDLPMRSILRAFLFKKVGIPHLVGSPYGKGGLVINWHIDDDSERTWARRMVEDGFLRENLQASIHITAGDFVDYPGDGHGFDACGKGREIVNLYGAFGTIGSHGGWGHNWFASRIENGEFGAKEIERYIVKNSECLESIVGYDIIEYSAPVGVYPQPMNTDILEELGFVAYYFTGDNGSSPNRSFTDGKMVSDRVIAFPVMPFGKSASLEEFELIDDRSEGDVGEWLSQTLEYVVENRTVRLIYSHPYNIYQYVKHDYQGVLSEFFDRLADLQKSGRIQVEPMSYFAEFLLRFLKTDYAFGLSGGKLTVRLKNKQGLDGIAVAIPKDKYRRPDADKAVVIEEDSMYYYVVITGNVDAKVLQIDAI